MGWGLTCRSLCRRWIGAPLPARQSRQSQHTRRTPPDRPTATKASLMQLCTIIGLLSVCRLRAIDVFAASGEAAKVAEHRARPGTRRDRHQAES